MPSNTLINYGEAPKAHSYGSKCRLAPLSHPLASSGVDDIPPVNAQYFYLSSMPIDDPLSTTIAATTDPKSARSSLRPFRPGDNNELEKAWLGLSSDFYRDNHTNARLNRPPIPPLSITISEKLHSIVRRLAIQHAEKHAREGPSRERVKPSLEALPEPDAASLLCCSELLVDIGVALRTSFCAVARRKQHMLNQDIVAQAIMSEMNTLHTDSTATVTERHARSNSVPPSQSQKDPMLRSGQVNEHTSNRPLSMILPSQTAADRGISISVPTKPSFVDDGISGRPFVRVGTPETPTFSPPASLPRTTIRPSRLTEEIKPDKTQSHQSSSTGSPSFSPMPAETSNAISREVTVGVSRLHEVSLPALQMKPIYWSPVNDIATVFRATWFYRYCPRILAIGYSH